LFFYRAVRRFALPRTARDALRYVDTAAHRYTVERGDKPNYEKHTVAHAAVGEAIRHEQVKRPELLKEQVKRNYYNQSSDYPSHIGLAPGASYAHAVTEGFDYFAYVFYGNDVSVIADVHEALAEVYIRAFYARSIVQSTFDSVLTAYTAHPIHAQARRFYFRSHVNKAPFSPSVSARVTGVFRLRRTHEKLYIKGM
jgi:hypothetical protein